MSDTYERREGLTIISRGGEYLRFLGGDDGVTRDEFSEDSTGGFDTESEGTDIDEDDIFSAFFTGEDTALDGGTVGDGFVGVDSLGRFLA